MYEPPIRYSDKTCSYNYITTNSNFLEIGSQIRQKITSPRPLGLTDLHNVIICDSISFTKNGKNNIF